MYQLVFDQLTKTKGSCILSIAGQLSLHLTLSFFVIVHSIMRDYIFHQSLTNQVSGLHEGIHSNIDRLLDGLAT